MAPYPAPLPDGFEVMFTDLYPRARQVAYRILGDRSEAEDAAAEAFTRALVTWRKVGALAFRDAWVLRVTANVAVDWRRRRRASVEVDLAVEGKCTGHQTVPSHRPGRPPSAAGRPGS